MRGICTLLVEGITLRRGGSPILKDVSLRCGAGLVALVGPNGSGKSTLLRAIAGILPIHGGRIMIAGHDLHRNPVAARQQLGYVPESPDLFPYLTPRELLGTFNSVRGIAPDTGVETYAALTSRNAVDARLGTLSAGQRRKLALVVATCAEPQVLLLDEPTNALDDAAVEYLRQLLEQWRQAGRTVLIAVHRPEQLGISLDAVVEVASFAA